MHRFFRRRRFLINPQLQLRLLMFEIGFVGFFALVVAACLFVPLMVDISVSDMDSAKAAQSASRFLYLHANFWPATILTLIAITLASIRKTHQIAGPLTRFNRILRQVQGGELVPGEKLRRGDMLHPEMAVINELLLGLRGRIGEIQESQTRLEEAIERCRRLKPGDSQETLAEVITNLVETGEELGSRVSFFKIK